MPLSDSSVPARKTIPRPDNLREGNLEANPSKQREGDRNRRYTNTRTPSVASGYSSTHRRGVDRDSSSSYGTAAVVPKPRRMLSAPLGRGYTGEQYLPPVVRSQGPVRSYGFARGNSSNHGFRLPQPQRPLPIIPPGPPLFGNRESRTLPARTMPAIFERVGFFDETPSHIRLRGNISLHNLEKYRTREYRAETTLQDQQQILFREPLDHQQLPSKPTARQYATKSVPRKEDTIVKKESELLLVPRKGARKHPTAAVPPPQEIIEIESDEELETVPNNFKGPSDDLLSAVKRLSFLTLRLQKAKKLPFLRRNLRAGFLNRCIQNNVETLGDKRANPQVAVVYWLYSSGDDSPDEYGAQMWEWLCPVCDLHGRFGTREMLEKHLAWDHKEIIVSWTHDRCHQLHAWKIDLRIPEPVDDDAFSDLWVLLDIPENFLPLPPLSSSSESATPPPDTPISTRHPSPIIIDDVEDGLEVKPAVRDLKFRYPSSSTQAPQSSLLLSQPSQSNRSTVLQSTQDPLGPLAQAPYLPYSNLHFSCRPGGPRLYDLINTLPMEPFGLLSWYVIDKEEELFEMNDTRDEDKVMQALWSRWILLNSRHKFIPNYFEGIRLFIEEYWSMIHLAAGWSALRVWLFLLVHWKYTTGPEVAQLLLHYESLVDKQQRKIS